MLISESYQIKRIFVFKQKPNIIVHVLTEMWEPEGVKSIRVKSNDYLIEAKYLGCGNVEGELAVMLKLLDDNQNTVKLDTRNSLLVGELELLIYR